ncbi:MAG: glycosyltransferase [Hyphomonadaceae bacterium]
MRRIAFIINSLEGGGAERVFCRVIQGLESRLAAWRTHVVLLDTAEEVYALPDFVETHRLDARGGMTASVVGLSRRLRCIKPDVAVSFLGRANCANVATAALQGHKAIISERTATKQHLGSGARGVALGAATAALYPRAARIIAVSHGVKRGLCDDFGVPADKVEVIYNPVDPDALRAQAAADEFAAPLPETFIASVGRLTANKNFPLLIDAFARAAIPYDLVILGEGAERAALEAQARRLGVGGRVHFLGFVHNPFAVLKRAAFFASASNAEGFPNALVEALSLGLPAIFTNCQAGPAEVLAGDPNLRIDTLHAARFGLLCPVGDVASLAEGLRFLAVEENRQIYAQRAAQRARAFAPAEIYARYWDAIAGVAA